MPDEAWLEVLRADPRPWLLGEETPAVRHLALKLLLDRRGAEIERARDAAMRADPIAAILDAQHPSGWWVKPGGGYAPKYRGTVWQVIFLDQLGADGGDPRVRAACEYVLANTQSPTGGFAASGRREAGPPAPATAIHCLHGNLLAALIGLGRLEDERVQRAVDWQARSITGEVRYYQSGTSGPGFACVANGKLPCAWGGIKALRALARIPPDARAPHVRRALDAGVEFLLSRDPAKADYPTSSTVSGSWFKLGFPSGYVADVLQNLEALAALGLAKNARLGPAIAWLVSRQDTKGRWKNEHAYNGKMWVDFERQGQPSKWVTLRACTVLRAASS